jgi:hypothetical protein
MAGKARSSRKSPKVQKRLKVKVKYSGQTRPSSVERRKVIAGAFFLSCMMEDVMKEANFSSQGDIMATMKIALNSHLSFKLSS